MNELKQEAIKKAYGEYYEQCNPDENGWSGYGAYETIGINIFGSEAEYKGFNDWRPKSLQGIENNNGWIRIESENDIELCDCFFVTKKGNIYLGNIKRSEGEFLFMNDIGEYTYDFITHYQPINKPNLPIY